MVFEDNLHRQAILGERAPAACNEVPSTRRFLKASGSLSMLVLGAMSVLGQKQIDEVNHELRMPHQTLPFILCWPRAAFSDREAAPHHTLVWSWGSAPVVW